VKDSSQLSAICDDGCSEGAVHAVSLGPLDGLNDLETLMMNEGSQEAGGVSQDGGQRI